MANVVEVTGPDTKGNYQATLEDGDTITFGPCQNPAYSDLNYWFVSLDGKDHTTYIVDMWGHGTLVQAIKARGSEKWLWENVAVHITHGLWNV